MLSQFPIIVYNRVEDFVETIMTPSNCRSSRVTLAVKDNSDITLPEPVCIYTDIMKPNFVGYSYVRLLTSLHFPMDTVYHSFHYPLNKPVEHPFTVSIVILLVTKTDKNMVFEDSDIPCLVILNFISKSSAQ